MAFTVFCKTHEKVALMSKWLDPFDLQGNVVGDSGHALHHFIIAAPTAAGQYHAGRDKDMFSVIWVFLLNFHQHFSRTAKRLVVHLIKSHHVIRASASLLGYVGTLDS